MKKRHEEYFAPPGTHRSSSWWRQWQLIARQLRYSIVLVLCAIAALTLYEVVAEAFKPGTRTIDWIAFVRNASCTWLVSLAPLGILMVLMNGVSQKRPLVRVIWLGIGMLCAIVGTVLTDFLFEGADTAWLLANPRDVLADTVTIVLPAGLLLTIYEFHRKTLAASESAVRAHADHIATEADLSKARLSLLRAQIEPHFIPLDPAIFVQVHRSVVVNLNAIRSLHRDFGRRL